MLEIFRNNLCLNLKEEIPFCYLDDMGKDEFE